MHLVPLAAFFILGRSNKWNKNVFQGSDLPCVSVDDSRYVNHNLLFLLVIILPGTLLAYSHVAFFADEAGARIPFRYLKPGSN
jgi:hypothetical protein